MTIFEEIQQERDKQDKKWGKQAHNPWYWMTILMEEVGEAAQCMCGFRMQWQKFRAELIQVAAVAVAMLEDFDERHKDKI